MIRTRYAAALIAALILILMTQVVALAQGIINDPPPPGQMPPIGGPISIELHSIDVVLDGPVATVHVTQIFRNNADWQVEGTYIFPLPADAAIGDFQMTVDGQVLEGQVYSKDEARRIYESIVRRRRDPALLEYLGQDLFQTSVFPIPPSASRKLELTYTHTLTLQEGLYHFHYPLQTRQYSSAPVQNLSLRVELRNQPGLRTIYSPSHDVRIDRLGDKAALVGFERQDIQPERDFDLYFGVSPEAIGLNLLSYKPAGEDGFFLLLAAPGIEVAADEVVQRDMILVMDVSGSMEGAKIEQTKQAAHFLVDNLNPGDRFNLIAFSTGVGLWSDSLQPGNQETIAAAHRWIKGLRAGGSTDINRALLEALAQLSNNEDRRPAYILFMTDGLPTLGETESDRIVRNALNNMPQARHIRLFTFGVGYDVDTDLLDTLSSELGGRSTYIKDDERIDEALGDFYTQISTPVLANVSIEFPGILVDDAYPYPIPDLFAGEQIIWAGRYRRGGDTTITLRGEVNGEERLFSYPDQQLAKHGGEPLVARLWATRKIGTLLDEIRRKGPLPELVDSVVTLSTTYGIITPYTSYLVLESDMQPDLAGSPVPMERTVGESRVIKEVQVTVEVEKVVEAPASGAAAVAASEQRQVLREADLAAEHQGVRYVAGKTFTFQGYLKAADGTRLSLWVDNSYKESMPLRTVRFGSDEYFALAADANMATWLSLSPEMVVVINETAYRITTSAADDAPTPSPVATPTPTPAPATVSTPSFWQTLVNWFRSLFAPPSP